MTKPRDERGADAYGRALLSMTDEQKIEFLASLTPEEVTAILSIIERAGAAAADVALDASDTTPLPDPPPQGGREQPEQGEREQAEYAAPASHTLHADEPPPGALCAPPSPVGGGISTEQAASTTGPSGEAVSLTARLRALYEETTVPVREIAKLAGVSERMVYNYARKFCWTPRVARAARGLRSLDPAGDRLAAAEQRAALLAGRSAQEIVAAARTRDAQERAAKEAEAELHTFETLCDVLVEVARMRSAFPDDPGRRASPFHRVAARIENAVLAMIERQMAAPEPAAD